MTDNMTADEKMIKQTDLKVCPFCGGLPQLTEDRGYDYGSYRYSYTCKNCYASSGKVYAEFKDDHATKVAEAIIKWNTRQAAQQAQVSEVLEFCYTSFGKMRKCDHLDQQIAESSQNMIKATLAAINGGGK